MIEGLNDLGPSLAGSKYTLTARPEVALTMTVHDILQGLILTGVYRFE